MEKSKDFGDLYIALIGLILGFLAHNYTSYYPRINNTPDIYPTSTAHTVENINPGMPSGIIGNYISQFNLPVPREGAMPKKLFNDLDNLILGELLTYEERLNLMALLEAYKVALTRLSTDQTNYDVAKYLVELQIRLGELCKTENTQVGLVSPEGGEA